MRSDISTRDQIDLSLLYGTPPVRLKPLYQSSKDEALILLWINMYRGMLRDILVMFIRRLG